MSSREVKRELKGTKTQSCHLLVLGFGRGDTRMQQLTVDLDMQTGFLVFRLGEGDRNNDPVFKFHFPAM